MDLPPEPEHEERPPQQPIHIADNPVNIPRKKREKQSTYAVTSGVRPKLIRSIHPRTSQKKQKAFEDMLLSVRRELRLVDDGLMRRVD